MSFCLNAHKMTGNQQTNVDEMQTSTFYFAESNSSNDEVDSYYGGYSPCSSCDDIEIDEEINDPDEEKKWIIF